MIEHKVNQFGLACYFQSLASSVTLKLDISFGHTSFVSLPSSELARCFKFSMEWFSDERAEHM